MTFSKLQLGCFDKPLAGWYNTDITPHIFVSRIPGLAFLLYKSGLIPEERLKQHQEGIFKNVHYLNVTKKFPFAHNTFDYVFLSHMLEHLYPWQAEYCMREVQRVLKVAGIVRVSVPDLDKVMASYSPKSAESFLRDFFESDQKRIENQHHWHYNETSLIQLLLDKAGFTKAYRCDFQQGICPDIELLDNRPESLFIEAVK